jgi:four helix bundle protein
LAVGGWRLAVGGEYLKLRSFLVLFFLNFNSKRAKMRNFRELNVWQDGRKFVNQIYDVTEKFPSDERYGLTSQLNRASVSIILNIAEGASRQSEKDFARFLEISIGSAFEVETILLISSDRQLLSSEKADSLIDEVHSIQRRLNAFITRLRQ